MLTLVAVALLAGGVAEARELTPFEFMQRFFANPASVFRGPARHTGTKAAETPLVEVPLPHLRPATASAAPVLGYSAGDDNDSIAAVATADMPLPRLRPADLLPAISAPAAKDGKLAALSPDALPPQPPLPELNRPPPAATSTCGVAIAALGVVATPLPPIHEEGECGIDEPVAVGALDGGKIEFSTKAIVDCHLAERLANWVNDTVKPKVAAAYGDDLTGLRIAASYSCRNRDSLPDTKISEHARGDAIDISGFRVGKRWIEVGPGWNGGGDDATFLADVRKSACGPFTTVLGPGSDSYHATHFHLDMIQRRTAGPSKGLYCK